MHGQRDCEAHPGQSCQLPRPEPHDPNARIRIRALSGRPTRRTCAGHALLVAVAARSAAPPGYGPGDWYAPRVGPSGARSPSPARNTASGARDERGERPDPVRPGRPRHPEAQGDHVRVSGRIPGRTARGGRRRRTPRCSLRPSDVAVGRGAASRHRKARAGDGLGPGGLARASDPPGRGGAAPATDFVPGGGALFVSPRSGAGPARPAKTTPGVNSRPRPPTVRAPCQPCQPAVSAVDG